MSDLAFALHGVTAATGNGFALRDVSFELPTGYVMGLIGANGAGKTTTIRCLLGMRGIDSGEIELLGHRMPGPVELRQDLGVVSIQLPILIRWGYTRVGLWSTTAPLALLLSLVFKSQMGVASLDHWLPVFWPGGVTVVAASTAVATALDRRR